jgi:ADP-ribose pyrophosphatase YjhB (NUDIX family)
MISFRSGGARFHLRAGAVVLDDEHLLLHRLEGDNFWALPGGRINMGEQAQLALTREFEEELSLSVECGPLVCVGENFFEYQGEPHHEVGLYFAVALPVGAPVRTKTAVHLGMEGDKRLEFKWFSLASLPHVDLRPRALREGLCAGRLPPHFVQTDANAA